MKTLHFYLSKIKEKCSLVLAGLLDTFHAFFSKINPFITKFKNNFEDLSLRGKLISSGCACLALAMVLFAIGLGTKKASVQQQIVLENDFEEWSADFITCPEPDFELVAELTPTASPEPLVISLGKGDDGFLISQVQLRLMELGYMDDDEPTEHFGSLTEEALTIFQVHNDLIADGVLRDATYNVLFSDNAKSYVMQNGDEGDNIAEVQERLYDLGYLAKDYVTGKFGEKTELAIREFQKANSLSADGKVGALTLETLYADDVVGNFFKKGDTDDTIKKYQERLIKLGYLNSNYDPKGKLDVKTVDAIKSFQESNNLVADGCLGPTTMEAIDSGKAIAYTLHLGMKGNQVKDVQKRLKELGYLTKNSQINGYYGEQTEDAVEAFQKRNGLSADGTVGEKTLAKLNSKNAKQVKKAATPKPTKKVSVKATKKPSKATETSKAKATAKPTAKPKVTPTPKPAKTDSGKIDNFIAYAKSKLGCKYVRGAKGPNTFDCSGFVYWCLKQAGVNQSYMTSIGWRKTSKYTRVNSLNEIKKGDVLVFTGSSSATGHVGIYLGGGQMIDASSGAGQVRITSSILSGKYWKIHFICGYHIWG